MATYFFDFSSSERARSAAAAFNRLICQLLTNEPSLKKLVIPVYTSLRGIRTDFSWDLEYLRLCLGAELLILLANEFTDKLQLCVSSRPNVDFIDLFGHRI